MGSVMTAYGTVRLMRDSKSKSGQAMVLLGAMSAAEGATKYCASKAIGSSVMNSNMVHKVKNSTVTQAASLGTGVVKNMMKKSSSAIGTTAKQSVGNIKDKMSNMTNSSSDALSSALSMGGTENISHGFKKSVTEAAHTVGDMAQTIAPKVSKAAQDLMHTTSSSNTTKADQLTNEWNHSSEATSSGKVLTDSYINDATPKTKMSTNGTTKAAQVTGSNGMAGANGSGKIITNSPNDTATPDRNYVNASGQERATNTAYGDPHPNRHSTSAKSENAANKGTYTKAKAGASKPLTDGAANKANLSKVAASAHVPSHKIDKDAPQSDILQ